MINSYFFLAGHLRYNADAAAKSAAGIGVPHKSLGPEYTRHAYCCSGKYRVIPSMVARVGLPKGRPVARLSGDANPARATTQEVGVSGGSYLRSYSLEAALWLLLFLFYTRNSSFLLRGCIMYDPTPLTLQEFIDQCRALAYAIIELSNPLAKELLTFILWERLNQLDQSLEAEVPNDE